MLCNSWVLRITSYLCGTIHLSFLQAKGHRSTRGYLAFVFSSYIRHPFIAPRETASNPAFQIPSHLPPRYTLRPEGTRDGASPSLALSRNWKALIPVRGEEPGGEPSLELSPADTGETLASWTGVPAHLRLSSSPFESGSHYD